MAEYTEKRKQLHKNTDPQQAIPTHNSQINTHTSSPLGLQRTQRGAGVDLSPTGMLSLQRSIGNRAVADLLHRDNSPRDNSQRDNLQRSSSLHIQAKLRVGAANDQYEQEADLIASHVMGQSRAAEMGHKHAQNTLQRKATMSLKNNAPIRNNGNNGNIGNEVTGSLADRIHSAQQGGQALPNSVRRTLEPTLGTDLSPVKVHTGPEAVQLTRELGAKAFTHKQHIFYGDGQSPADLQLTAHEAVHTIQQGALAGKIQRWPWSKKKDKNIKDRRRSYGANDLLPVQINEPVANLRMHIYTGEWEDNPVGHAWLELQYHKSQLPMHLDQIDQLPILPYSKEQLKGGQHASFGFWPLHTTSKPGVMKMREEGGKTPGEGRTTDAGFGGFRLLPGKATTQGRVEEDDQKWQHKTNAIITYKLTQPQVGLLTDYISRTREAAYSPYGLNCTTFALNAINATGHKAPAKYRISPKGVFKNLKGMAKKGDKNVSIFKPEEFLPKMKDVYNS